MKNYTLAYGPTFLPTLMDLVTGITANSKSGLIEQLEAECKSPRRNGSRYYLGLRTLSCIPGNNIDQIIVDELKELRYRLRPFFLSYSHKISRILCIV